MFVCKQKTYFLLLYGALLEPMIRRYTLASCMPPPGPGTYSLTEFMQQSILEKLVVYTLHVGTKAPVGLHLVVATITI